MKIGAVSGDLVVKLALYGAAGIAAWVLLQRARDALGNLPRDVGNAAADAATDTVHSAATAVGGALVSAVDAVPGLTNYLKDISGPPIVSVQAWDETYDAMGNRTN